MSRSDLTRAPVDCQILRDTRLLVVVYHPDLVPFVIAQWPNMPRSFSLVCCEYYLGLLTRLETLNCVYAGLIRHIIASPYSPKETA